MNNRKNMMGTLMAFAMANAGESAFSLDPMPKGRTKKDYAPWAGEHIPKKLRKGKTYEEIQELRKRAYEERTGVKIEEDKADSFT